MPLIIVCGYPAAGKTTLVNKLATFLQQQPQPLYKNNVHIINDQSLNILSNDYFSNANEEKKVRAAFLAASERFVSRDAVVIVDSLNYIKGFRYQLYCQARAVSTPHLVIHCESREETCRVWNTSRAEKNRIYPADQLEDLFLRFEVPNNQTKWDSPLFPVVTEANDHLTTFFETLLPTINSTPSRPPSISTLTPTSSSTPSVQVLDHETQIILDTILKAQQNSLPLVRFPTSSSNKSLQLPRPVSVTTLSRIRRQFLHLNRLHPTNDPVKIRDLFIDYLSSNMYL